MIFGLTVRNIIEKTNASYQAQANKQTQEEGRISARRSRMDTLKKGKISFKEDEQAHAKG